MEKTSQNLLNRGNKFLQQQQLKQAADIFDQLIVEGSHLEHSLNALVQISIQSQQPDKAIEYLRRLVTLYPSQLGYCNMLTRLYAHQGQWQKAASCYQDFIGSNSPSAEAFFNLAYYLRKAGDSGAAIEHYSQSLKHGIASPEEVWLNLANIYSEDLRDEQRAIECLDAALKINPHYRAAHFNLANLLEESGHFDRAIMILQQLHREEPGDFRVLARMAWMKRYEREDALVSQLENACKARSLEADELADVEYATAKVLDDIGQYPSAFQHYVRANKINQRLMPPYSPAAFARQIDDIIKVFDREWLESNALNNSSRLTFICGMFRSGSTLVEQILSSHQAVTAGGEIDFFVRHLGQSADNSSPEKFPKSRLNYDKGHLEKLAQQYSQKLSSSYPDAGIITDKRPENFLYVGILRAMFPRAKFVFTRRNPADNCLSVFFQRLGQSMNYANDLSNIAHYMQHQTRLLEHWTTLFPENIDWIQYEHLVAQPEEEIRRLLAFQGLEWQKECLSFERNPNRVKTASAWQVRQPIHVKSAGRWQNYQECHPLLKQMAESQ